MAKKDLEQYLEKLRQAGLDPEREARFTAEALSAEDDHTVVATKDPRRSSPFPPSLYAYNDMKVLQQQERVRGHGRSDPRLTCARPCRRFRRA